MKRLEAVFSCIKPCGTFADIGCDHGLTSQYALNYAKKVIATDISQDCLLKARRLIGTCENVEFRVGDGLNALLCDPDVICISGMGGHTVVGILTGYAGRAELILQPQTDVPLVRTFLTGNGYGIEKDITAYESGKFYDILNAVPFSSAQSGQTLDEMQLRFGMFYKERNPLLKARLEKLLNKVKSYKQTDENVLFMSQIKEALVWQR